MKSDGNIISPNYYQNAGNIECWDCMRMMFDEHTFADHCLLTAFKYLWRAGNKDDFKQDIDKAYTYMNHAKETCVFNERENLVYNTLWEKYKKLRDEWIESEADGAD